MSQRRLQRAAPELLKAAKGALRMLLDGAESNGNIRTDVVRGLADAIDHAEPPVLEPHITLVMTHASYDVLRQEVNRRATQDELGTRLSSLVHKDARLTKQRVYLQLQTETALLRRLRTILDRATQTRQTRRAFERLVEQLDREVLNKSPLVRLAETAL